MIDIHTHIVPGLDDGSQDMETSVMMAEMAARSGVSALIATPHCNQMMFPNFLSDSLIRRMEGFREEVIRENIELDLAFGMEIFCTKEVPRLLKEKKLLSLNGGRYVLVEFNFGTDVEPMEDMLYSIMDAGYVPIIAHPERYRELQGQFEIVSDWMDEGMGIQINKGSLFGHFGRAAGEFAYAMLRHGLCSCVASDAHGADARTTDMTEIYNFLAAEFSEAEAERLLTENPMRIFNNKPLLGVNNIQPF